MNVTPSFYQHLILLLNGLADGKLAVCLEGGYFHPSLAEGCARTLLGLLDYPAQNLGHIRRPKPEVESVINNLKFFLKPYWKCFDYCQIGDPADSRTHKVNIEYFGRERQRPFQTRGTYPKRTYEEEKYHQKLMKEYLIGKKKLLSYLRVSRSCILKSFQCAVSKKH